MQQSFSNRVSWFLVILVGVGVGFFLWRTYSFPLPPSYVLDFLGSEVLTVAPPTPVGYFRKNLYLPTQVRHAWLSIAASEGYALFINGKSRGEQRTFAIVARDIYDVTNFLTPGKNVIALRVYRKTFPEPPWVRVVGGYTTWDGSSHAIVSDLSWKADKLKRNVLREDQPLLWNETLYNDADWPQPIIHPRDWTAKYPPLVDTWPLLLTTPPQGPWVWKAEGVEPMVRLTHAFTTPGAEIHKAWIRLSGLCPYRLLLNGETVAMKAEPEEAFDLYDLKPLMSRGQNRLDLQLRRAYGRVGALAEVFVEKTSGEVEIFRGSEGWTTPAEPGERESTAPALLAPYPSYPGFTLAQKRQELLSPWWFPWQAGLSALLIIAGAVLMVVGHWRLWEIFWRQDPSDCSPRGQLALFHLPAGLFLGFVALLTFDIKFPPEWPFQPWVIFVAVLLIVGGQIFGGLLHQKG